MSNKEKIQQIIAETDQIRLRINGASEQLQEFLAYQQTKVSGKGRSFALCGLCQASNKQVDLCFQRAFKTLSDLEKAELYLLNMRNSLSVLSKPQQKFQIETFNFSEQVITIDILLKSTSFTQKQSVISAQLLKKQKIIKIDQYKVEIDLHNFIIRKLKDQSLLVLQAIYYSSIGNTIVIGNSGLEFQNALKIIVKVWEQAQYENVERMIRKGKSDRGLIKNGQFNKLKSRMTELTQNQSLNILSSDDQFSTIQLQVDENSQSNSHWCKPIIQSFSTYENFQKKSFNQYHENKGQKIRKHLLFSSSSSSSPSSSSCQNKKTTRCQNILKSFQSACALKKMKYFIKSIKITKLKKQEFLIQQLHQMEGKLINFQYIRKFVIYHGAAYVIDRDASVSDFGCGKSKGKEKEKDKGNFIRYCVWRIRDFGALIQVFVEANIQYVQKDKNYVGARKKTSQFIGELELLEPVFPESEILIDANDSPIIEQENENDSPFVSQENQNENKQIDNNQIQDEQFYTLPGDFIEDSKQKSGMFVQFREEDMSLGEPVLDLETNFQKFIPFSQQQQNQLTTQHPQLPYKKQKPHKIMGINGHWLWQNEWVIKDNGDLVNIDQQKIQTQSNVLKLVLKNMSRNLLSGKSILNTSLPIQIFGTDSNLERLARGYIFGPIFLEKAAEIFDPIERLKLVICFAVGYTLSYIKMEKPFNPILGETYQALIDGCPVYAEQISHHPPISSLYMIGRGYKIYGNLEAKVELGLNKAAGINEGFNHIEFEKYKGNIRFISPPGELSGLVYGDRKITVTKKSYYFDDENKLLCEIRWGSNKETQDMWGKFNDYFSGRIVKVNCHINEANSQSIQKCDIVEQYGQVRGRFTQFVYYDDDLLFDVNRLAPHQICDYNPCLASDSRNRKDVIFRKLNDFMLAQEAKEELEILQRRDRKLRENHHK